MSLSTRLKAAALVLWNGSISTSGPRPSGGSITASGESVNDRSALSLSAVWGCVNLLAGTVATLPVGVYRRTGPDGQREAIGEHTLARILNVSPNYDQTGVDFWEFMGASIELWGNAYAEKETDGGKVIGLLPINPARMSTRRLESGAIEYRWSDDRGRERTCTDAKMFHIRGFGGDPLGGLSTLQFARQSFGLAQAVETSAARTFRNGIRPSGVVTFKDWLTEDQRQTAHTDLVEQFAGAENAGRPLVMEGGMTWTQLSINPDDAQMLETRRFSVEEVCRFFGVPPHMIGHTEASTSWGTGLEQQTLGFQKFTLRRRLKRIEQAAGKQLLTAQDRGNGIYVEFNLEGLLRADSAARAAHYASGLQHGWMTINEVRRLENLPAVAGGNVPRMQIQNVPLTEAGAPTPPKGIAP